MEVIPWEIQAKILALSDNTSAVSSSHINCIINALNAGIYNKYTTNCIQYAIKEGEYDILKQLSERASEAFKLAIKRLSVYDRYLLVIEKNQIEVINLIAPFMESYTHLIQISNIYKSGKSIDEVISVFEIIKPFSDNWFDVTELLYSVSTQIVKRGDDKAFKMFYEKIGDNASAKISQFYQDMLTDAVWEDNAPIVKFILERCSYSNAVMRKLFRNACTKDQSDVLVYLLNNTNRKILGDYTEYIESAIMSEAHSNVAMLVDLGFKFDEHTIDLANEHGIGELFNIDY